MKWRSGAKINLTLEVLGRRADGYHELRSLVHSVGLWDEINIELNNLGRLSLTCNVAELQCEDNLCLRAARCWFEAAAASGAASASGLAIDLVKNIPAGAGLGGASGNAAAILLALNKAHNHLLQDAVIRQLARQLGADVTFFLGGGCALMEGVGEQLTVLSDLAGWVLILMPRAMLQTPVVYRRWDELQRGTAGLSRNSAEAAVSALPHGVVALAPHLSNDLLHAAGAAGVDVTPWVDLLVRGGAAGASMTGSGAAVFGLFESHKSAQACGKAIGGELAVAGLEPFTAPLTAQAVVQVD